MKKPSITLRYGASHDDIVVDGHTFTRHKLSGGDLAMVRNVVIDSLVKCGSVRRQK